jgi:hypothetical protein
MQQPPDPNSIRRNVPEMVGATSSPFHLRKEITNISFPVRAPIGPARIRPDLTLKQLFLRIENMTSDQRAPTMDVYVNLPEGESHQKHPELYVDSLAMFGLVESSRPSEHHAENGMSFHIDLTKVLYALETAGKWNGKSVRVTFIPGEWNGDIDILVGRMSLYVE